MYVYMKYPPIHSRSGAVGQLQPHSYYFLATHPLVSQWTVSQSKACWLPGLLMTYLRLANSLIISLCCFDDNFLEFQIGDLISLIFISDYLLILLCDGSQSRVEESKSRVAHCLCCLPNCIALHSLILFHCIASVATAGCMCMEMVGRLIKVEFPLQLKGWGGEGK